jgi:hypothetical protein
LLTQLDEIIRDWLPSRLCSGRIKIMAVKVGINGFGRIGRLALRAMRLEHCSRSNHTPGIQRINEPRVDSEFPFTLDLRKI